MHLAHERAHLHRVLVLVVQAVGLEEAEEWREGDGCARGDVGTIRRREPLRGNTHTRKQIFRSKTRRRGNRVGEKKKKSGDVD